MDFSEVLRKRRMVRAFLDEPLEPAVVQRLLEAANRAPSAGFSQGYALLVLEGPGQVGRLWELMDKYGYAGGSEGTAEPDGPSPVTRAPVVVVPLSCKEIYLDRYAREDKGWTDRDEAHWPVPYWHIDTGFTALLMLLAAVDEGLGALFFGIPPEIIGEFRAAYGVPEQYHPIGAVAVGHPDWAADPGGSARVIRRRSLDDLVHRGRWLSPGRSAGTRAG
jgi:nitroreductase